jgi:hypothetical protein
VLFWKMLIPGVKVLVFDMCSDTRCSTALKYIRKRFPTSDSMPDVELIVGDSTKTVPEYIQKNPRK